MIRDVSDLPKWYSRLKYQGLEKLSCLDWYWQLSARVELWNFVRWGATPDDFYDKFPNDTRAQKAKEIQRKTKELLELVRNHPILDTAAPEFAINFIDHLLPRPVPGVDYASVDDIENQLFYLRLPTQTEAREYLSQKKDSPPEQRLHTSPIADLQREYPGEILIKVRLDAPERLLCENFSAFIQNAKAAWKIGEPCFGRSAQTDD